LQRLLRRACGGAHELATCAYRQYTVAPAVERWSPPAMHFGNELPLITGAGPFTTLEEQMHLIAGGTRTHGPVIAYELHDATLAGSRVYCGALKHFADGRPEQLLRPYQAEHLSEGVLACSYFGNRYFGHSIRDDLPLLLLAESLGTPIRTSAPLFAHQSQLLEMLGMGARPFESVRFDRLTLLDDHHMSDHRVQRYRELRRRIAQRFPARPHPGVFIRRGGKGERRSLEGEEALMVMLHFRGFKIVDPDVMSASEILSEISGARIVVAVEGSHTALSVLAAADNCTFLLLQPPDRFNNVFKGYTDAMGMRYAFLIGMPTGPGRFRFLPDNLARMLDRIEEPEELLAEGVQVRRRAKR
jgi:capsular polysaccharide biosynthesis protein